MNALIINNSIIFFSNEVTLSGIAKILALIGTLFAVLNAPNGISQLIGADLSVSSSLQSLQTTMIGTGLLGGALRTAGTAAKDAGALSVYGAGRMVGGSSILQQISNMASGVSSPLVSSRPVSGGFGEAVNSFSSGNGAGGFVSSLVSGGLPNIARAISSYNTESGSFSSIAKNSKYSGIEKITRMGSRALGWGASRAYAAASNRVSSLGHRSPVSQNNSLNRMSLMNSISGQNKGS
ncbi:MAG: hypothetical protein IJK53_07355 [Erysipelotrichaceae bacterium]|nr:hypothetical protein [Clostridia bacterium]MBQ6217186.1 hypothetical protein [Erysipelotrichaceae bacterium]